MLSDPSRRASGSATNSLQLPVANDVMLERVSQLSMPPRTATSALNSVHASFPASSLPFDRMLAASRPRPAENEFDAVLSVLRCVDQLPIPPRATATAMDRGNASVAVPGLLPSSDRILDAALPHLTENVLNVVLQRLLVVQQEQQQSYLLRERQLSEMLVQEMREREAPPLSQALALGPLAASAFFAEQEPLQLSSLRYPDRVPSPMNPESVLAPAFRPGWAFTVPDRIGAHHPAQPSLPERAVKTQAGRRCSQQGEASLGERRPKRRRKGETFPVVLHRLLLDVESMGSQAVISFTPSGSAFRVHQPDAFMNEIAPKYFRQRFFTSFTRQLNTYGFDKLASWPDEGAFAHPKFKREKPELCKYISAREPEDYRDTSNPLYQQDGDDA
jgi:hypothetical protein